MCAIYFISDRQAAVKFQSRWTKNKIGTAFKWESQNFNWNLLKQKKKKLNVYLEDDND